jgi:hypothetical protein
VFPIVTDCYEIHFLRWCDLYRVTDRDGFPQGTYESLAEALHFAQVTLCAG